jgi:hypothetical protein
LAQLQIAQFDLPGANPTTTEFTLALASVVVFTLPGANPMTSKFNTRTPVVGLEGSRLERFQNVRKYFYSQNARTCTSGVVTHDLRFG